MNAEFDLCGCNILQGTTVVTDLRLIGSGSESSRVTAAEGPEEESPLREQLNKAWKRIADLETRVHDLTLQTTMVCCVFVKLYSLINACT